MSKDEPKLSIHISGTTVLKVFAVMLGIWFLYVIRDIIAIFFIALMLASVIEPLVNILERRRFPRPLAVVSIYLLLLLVVALIISVIVPPLASQVGALSETFPAYYEKLLEGFSNLRSYSESNSFLGNFQTGLEELELSFRQASQGVLSFLSALFGGIVSLVLVLVITFYFLIERDAITEFTRSFVPERFLPYLADLYGRIEYKIGRWVKGELILMLIIGTLSFIGLSILGVRYPLVLATLAGIFEVVPYIGPLIAVIPAVFLALTDSAFKALAVIILYWAIQQAENHLIVPRIMQRAVGLNPIVTIVVILIGFRLAGIIGAVLAVPVTTAVSIIVKDFLEKSELKVVKPEDTADSKNDKIDT